MDLGPPSPGCRLPTVAGASASVHRAAADEAGRHDNDTPLAPARQRVRLFGHDAGHQQIASSRKVHDLLGLFHGNLLLGMSYGWWNDKHNRHHANPNHTGKDPDVAAGVLVWTLDQARGRAGLHGWLTRHQAKLFFPLLLLEGFNLTVSSIRGLRNRPAGVTWTSRSGPRGT